jgi:hypothetical protein
MQMQNALRYYIMMLSFLTGFCLIYWLGAVLEPLIAGGKLSYVFTGWLNALFYSALSAGLLVPLSDIRLRLLIVISIWLSLIFILMLFFSSDIALPFFNIFFGLFSGLWVRQLLLIDYKLKWMAAGFALLGMAAGSFTSNITTEVISILVVISACLLITGVLISIKRNNLFISAEYSISFISSFRAWRFWWACIAVSLMLWTELHYIIWQLLIPAYVSESGMYIVLPLLLLCIAIFRFTGSVLSKKFSNILWLYLMAFLVTISIGMFFTLQIYLFILMFSFGVAYFIPLFLKLTGQMNAVRLIVGIAFLFTAVMQPVTGHNAGFYIEFAQSIQIPEPLILLSAMQSIVKDIVVGPALVIVFTGLSFLFRKKLFV